MFQKLLTLGVEDRTAYKMAWFLYLPVLHLE